MAAQRARAPADWPASALGEAVHRLVGDPCPRWSQSRRPCSRAHARNAPARPDACHRRAFSKRLVLRQQQGWERQVSSSGRWHGCTRRCRRRPNANEKAVLHQVALWLSLSRRRALARIAARSREFKMICMRPQMARSQPKYARLPRSDIFTACNPDHGRRDFGRRGAHLLVTRRTERAIEAHR